MNLASRRVPAWWVVAAATLAAAVAAGGSAIAVSGPDTIERMRGELVQGKVATAAGGRQIVRAQTSSTQGRLVYVAASFDNPSLSQSVSGVRCPRRSQVTGGGVLSETRDLPGQVVNSSLPFDGGDRNTATDDGWIAAVDNLTRGKLRFGVYAICRKKT